jgi:hypothetical protein
MLTPTLYHESNTQGVGLMYRVIDTRGIFKLLVAHNFGNQTCKLKLTVIDEFLPENNGPELVIHFINGQAHVQAAASYDYEVSLELDVANFSSLLMGAVDFLSLYKYGLAKLSDTSYIETIQQLFKTAQKPQCMTRF